MKFLIGLLLASISITSFAETVNIDFQSLEQVNVEVNTQGFTYSEDGYTLDNLGALFPFASYGTLESRYPGSTALINNTVSGITRLTKSDAGTFTLNSIDLASLFGAEFSSFEVFFTGTKSDESTVNQVFTGTESLLTYAFIGFDNLLSVEWSQDSPFHQFDNINLTSGEDGPSPVPVPAASWLLGSVVLGFFGLRRKNQV
jgi:hypothetical protein